MSSDTTKSEGSPSHMASLAVIAACLALGGISALESRHVSVTHGFPLDWSVVLASTTPRWLFLAAVMPVVLRLARRWPPVPLRASVVALHLGVFVVLSLSQAMVDAWAKRFAQPFVPVMFSWVARVTRAWYNTMPTMLSTYVAVLVTAWGMTESRERERRTLRGVQLEAQPRPGGGVIVRILIPSGQAPRLATLAAVVEPLVETA